MSRTDTYAPTSKLLHWLTAACVLLIVPMGVAMMRVPEGDLQNFLFDGHRSLGVLVFALAVLRVAARSVNGVPTGYEGLTPFERRASTAVHHLLLVLILVMPLIGWIMMSAYPADVPVFALFTLPNLLSENQALYKVLAKTHEILGLLMAAIVGLHIAGALMHAVIKQDGVLQRMLPRGLAQRLDKLHARGAANRSL